MLFQPPCSDHKPLRIHCIEIQCPNCIERKNAKKLSWHGPRCWSQPTRVHKLLCRAQGCIRKGSTEHSVHLVCILLFCFRSTYSSNHCRILEKAFDKDWSGTGTERQGFLKKGETTSISPCADSLPESSGKKTSAASWLRQKDPAASLGGPQIHKAVQMRHTNRRSTHFTLWNVKACCWTRSRNSDWIPISRHGPWCGEVLLADCVLPGRPWIFVPWIHPKGWRCLHSRCWLADSCGNYSSWYSWKRKGAPLSLRLNHTLQCTQKFSQYIRQLVSLQSTQHLIKPTHWNTWERTKPKPTRNKKLPP